MATSALSDVVRALHCSNGVDIRQGVGVNAFTGATQVRGAEPSDGATLAVDVVIVGVGIEPDTKLAQAAGLRTENGVWTDAFGRTSGGLI